MKKTELPTMQDNELAAAYRRESLYDLLERLETEALPDAEYEQICKEANDHLTILHMEREQMLRYMAEESIFADEAETRLREIRRVHDKKEKRRLVSPAPTNAQIDSAEKQLRHFAQGMSFYKLFWVFFIGCFGGVMVERIWALIRYGVLEPRVGLIYGPFNLVYGLGAFALTAALYPVRSRNRLFSFLGGMLIGSAVEYGCSLFQEAVFGSVSWDYSNRPFNLNGRICLLYSVYWGVLGVMWIKDLYPRMVKGILKIPNRIGKPLTWLLVAFMAFNTLATGMTVFRWYERRTGKAPGNAVECYFDAHYPDARMERIFSNLAFVEEAE